MCFKNYYKDASRNDIKAAIEAEGFTPLHIDEEAGYVHETHQHEAIHLLAFLAGDMEITIEGKVYHCQPSDKIIIPANTPHKAVDGKNGCTYFWSEKIV